MKEAIPVTVYTVSILEPSESTVLCFAFAINIKYAQIIISEILHWHMHVIVSERDW